jgi:N-acetylglucosaminyl-diphospho-decaprenol L-rhamnosyltransferase
MCDVALIIVSWNVCDLLRACLTSVYTDLAASDLDATVWVVDNASHDGSAAMVRDDFPQVRLVVSQVNLGFAGGNNLVLRHADGPCPPRYVLLLNPDTALRPGVLRTLTDFMACYQRVGVAGARLFYGDGRFQHSAFGFPGLWQILFDLFPLPGRLHESRLNGRYPRAWYERGDPFPVDHPLGAAMMVHWDAVRQIGLFDEGFHMYCEEIDWCMRMKQAGWRIYCVPKAEVIHYEGQSTRQIRAASFVNLWRSRRRLYDKHYRPVKRRLAKRLVRAGMKYNSWMAKNEEKRGTLDQAEVASRLQAYSDVLAYFD